MNLDDFVMLPDRIRAAIYNIRSYMIAGKISQSTADAKIRELVEIGKEEAKPKEVKPNLPKGTPAKPSKEPDDPYRWTRPEKSLDRLRLNNIRDGFAKTEMEVEVRKEGKDRKDTPEIDEQPLNRSIEL